MGNLPAPFFHEKTAVYPCFSVWQPADALDIKGWVDMNVFWWIVGAALIIKLVVWLTEYLNGETNDNAEARETERQERIAALRETLSSRIAEVVSEHLPTLRKKQQQCLYYDDYGVLCGTDDWAREQKYFKDNVLVRDSIIDTTVALVLLCQIRHQFDAPRVLA